MEVEAEAMLINSKSKEEWFLGYLRIRLNIQDTGYATGYRNRTMVLHH